MKSSCGLHADKENHQDDMCEVFILTIDLEVISNLWRYLRSLVIKIGQKLKE